jgi:hypothetical protein
MPNPQEISRYCSSLVVLVTAKDDQYVQDDSEDSYTQDDSNDLYYHIDDSYNQDGKVVMLQLAHFSVKEYLTSTRLDIEFLQYFQEINAKASMAIICLAYLLQLNSKLPVDEIKRKFPLAHYSAKFWIIFAVVAESTDEKLQGYIRKFFCDHGGSYWNCYTLHPLDSPWKILKTKEPCSALYYASFGGLMNTVEYLISSGANVNGREGGRHGTALQTASRNGHKEVVELLVRSGADVSAPRGEGGYDTALQEASTYGHKEIVELLVRSGADVNARGGLFYIEEWPQGDCRAAHQVRRRRQRTSA